MRLIALINKGLTKFLEIPEDMDMDKMVDAYRNILEISGGIRLSTFVEYLLNHGATKDNLNNKIEVYEVNFDITVGRL